MISVSIISMIYDTQKKKKKKERKKERKKAAFASHVVTELHTRD